MSISKTPTQILWLQVWALAGVQGAITLTWLIYNVYLSKLLTQFGFPASFAVGLLVLENALAVIMEPLMGGLSDRSQRWMGTRFPFISAGVILASGLFIAIPCIVTFLPPGEVIRLILPLTLVAWALAMTVFRSPAIALLVKYAMPAELPLAVSVVTLAAGVIGAFRPIANSYLLNLSPVFAFSIGSFVLVAAAFALRLVNPPDAPTEIFTPKIPIKNLGLILGTGLGVAWGSRLLMDALGKLLKAKLNTDVSMLMVGIGLIIALAYIPGGWVASKVGNKLAMLCGVGTTILGMVIMLYMGALFPIIFIIIAGFSLIVNGVIPLALELMPLRWVGLGIGMYFGGFSLAMSIFGMVFPQPQAIAPSTGLGIGAVAFLLGGGCIFLSHPAAQNSSEETTPSS
ncbi:MFS transporter [Richelia sinica]|uniref:MFS transporter n=1 Tax=Richelia sinica TaxID=1357545 RepID=UPI00168330D7|nr:MFS transporter [Richelia sinica]MBD2663712.1 MFS transporter [Richelia sinica FACHB-800]